MGKTTGESKTRVTTGIVLAVMICTALLLSHIPAVLSGTVVLLNVGAVFEIFRAAHMLSERRLLWTSIIVSVVVSLLPIPRYENVVLYAFIAAIVVFASIMYRCGRCVLDVPVSVCGICLLVTLLFKSIHSARNLENGFFCLLFAVLAGCATDVFAYLTGKTIGRHKLCPVISPNKTVEGSIGGIAGTVALLLLLGLLLEKTGLLQVNYPMLALYAVVSSIAGQFGDLSMSAVKRCFGVKDYGTLFPGHGGVLDRFDSLLMIAPFTLLFCRNVGPFFL